MVAYEKLTNKMAQNDIRLVEMRFAANESITTVECGRQTYELAPLRTRIAAAAIDLFILTAVEFIFSSVLGTAGLPAGLAFLFVFQWYFLSERFGQTPGKMVMNIFVIRADGEFPGARDACWRTVGYLLNVLAMGLGWLWIIADRREQGWHDKLAHTYVVKS